jgi:hypothetical protein
MVLPDVLVPLQPAGWDSHGRPLSGPVFPCRRGSRAGEREGKGISYVTALRDALWAAGIVRPAPGFEQATTDTERRKLCLIQSGSTELRPLDVHSFRRAYNTALADANVQDRLAPRGPPQCIHAHARYVMRTGASRRRRLGPRSAIQVTVRASSPGSRSAISRIHKAPTAP